MIASERARHIINRLREEGIVSLKNIADEMGVSGATVRRDFEKLENEGRLKRVAGGAVLSENGSADSLPQIPDSLRAYPNYSNKCRVAEAACCGIEDGQCIFVDGGSSAAALAPCLENRKIKIVTNNGLFVREIKNNIADVVVLGGTYLYKYSVSMGNICLQTLSQFHFDRVFISCSGADISGNTVYSPSVDATNLKRAAMENSDKCCLLLDCEKLKRRDFCKLGSLSDFNRVFCNKCPDLNNYPENFVLV